MDSAFLASSKLESRGENLHIITITEAMEVNYSLHAVIIASARVKQENKETHVRHNTVQGNAFLKICIDLDRGV